MTHYIKKPVVDVGQWIKVEYEWETWAFGFIGDWRMSSKSRLTHDLDIQILKMDGREIKDIIINGKKIKWEYDDAPAALLTPSQKED